MLDCHAAPTPMDQNQKVIAQSGELLDKERYQRQVGRLSYLYHTRRDIAYVVGIESRYMHEPRSGHMDVVH
jgi:hypothetical protein